MHSLRCSASWLLAVLALFLGGCSGRKNDPATAAKLFFEQIAAGQAQTAYQSAAFGLQAQRSAAAFETAVKDMGLVNHTAAQWEPPEVDGRSAKIHVKITTQAGQQLPLIVTLTEDSRTWRVYSLHSPPNEQTGISENRFTLVGKAPTITDGIIHPAPPEKEVRGLLRENLLNFNEAIAARSFDAFYDSVSRKWQDQLTKGQLQRAFQPFIDKQVSIGGIREQEAIFDAAPAVNSEGLLIVSGYYPTQPYRVVFALKFIYELPTWKLFGLDVNLKK
jgi:hypothetical protein